jgi:hypothetical protein
MNCNSPTVFLCQYCCSSRVCCGWTVFGVLCPRLVWSWVFIRSSTGIYGSRPSKCSPLPIQLGQGTYSPRKCKQFNQKKQGRVKLETKRILIRLRGMARRNVIAWSCVSRENCKGGSICLYTMLLFIYSPLYNSLAVEAETILKNIYTYSP